MMGRNKDIPIERVLEMQRRGMQNSEIIGQLQQEGYGHDQISDAMDQAQVKSELSNIDTSSSDIGNSPDIPMGLLNAPSPSGGSNSGGDMQPSYDSGDMPTPNYYPESTFAPEPLERASYDSIEEIAESIIKEKWDELLRSVGDIRLWKERMDIDLEGVKQELVRTQEKFESLQKAIMGRIKEYSDGVTNISTEMKALERVLQNILSPLTRSVKDLQEATERVSRRRSSTRRKSTRKRRKRK